jgi:hypothetical protein
LVRRATQPGCISAPLQRLVSPDEEPKQPRRISAPRIFRPVAEFLPAGRIVGKRDLDRPSSARHLSPVTCAAKFGVRHCLGPHPLAVGIELSLQPSRRFYSCALEFGEV